MTAKLARPATEDALFLWVMHRFSEVFEDHAVIKGGMALMLLDSPRSTMDIDYVFVPFTSKKDIAEQITNVLNELEDSQIKVDFHSKMLRAEVQVDTARILVEANVATECRSVPMATGGFANSLGQPSQIVRIMDPGQALSHKIAAWNERRLMRDLYDCYFLFSRAGAKPEMAILAARLENIQSRLPRLKSISSMSRDKLIRELEQEAAVMTEKKIEQQLEGILPAEELAGLLLRIRSSIERLCEYLRGND